MHPGMPPVESFLLINYGKLKKDASCLERSGESQPDSRAILTKCCVFCARQKRKSKDLHKCSTLNMDKRLREMAEVLEDE